MSRYDTKGMFWDDEKRPRPPPQAKPKRTPPPRTWEEPGYLPGLAEALAFNVPVMSDAELEAAFWNHERLVFDCECYGNYFLAAFKSLTTGKIAYVESYTTPAGIIVSTLDTRKLHWLMHSFLTVGFYSLGYDVPMCTVAIAGANTYMLKEVSDAMIMRGERPSDVLKVRKLRRLKIDHIDIQEVTPLRVSLKTYGGRLHCRRLQDLPFPPATILTPEQMAIVRLYCCNDLETTADTYGAVADAIKLREKLSIEYRVDIRSKSDPQVAETIISEELQHLTGKRPTGRQVPEGWLFRYKVPPYLQYRSRTMQNLLAQVHITDFMVDHNGYTGIPDQLEKADIRMGGMAYTIGLGGLHSTEESAGHVTDLHFKLLDWDVTSFYPLIILTLGLFPLQLGPIFLEVFRKLVELRIRAKKNGDKLTAESLKIAINGIFGKLGSPYSILYSPELLIQVTLTGQLVLLMLIERLEWEGISIVSANTDGVTAKCPRHLEARAKQIVAQWEQDTGFTTELSEYLRLNSRDVNNYIAIKPDGTTKGKGVYANPWVDGGDSKKKYERLSKNPQNSICVDAIEALFVKGVPIETTINACTDPSKFCNVRNVKGGAVKDGTYLGKVIRWYYAQGEAGQIIYALNGNAVPRSQGARPLMDMPKALPLDLDRAWYINEAYSMLVDIGYHVKEAA